MRDNGGPAFPHSYQWTNERKNYIEQDYADGMTLRDYFAGQALANLNLQAHVAKPAAEYMAKSAYEIADAMLRERAK